MARRATTPLPPSIRGARWIALGGGKFALVDAQDYTRAIQIPWRYHTSHTYAYYAGREGEDSKTKRQILYLHRFILRVEGIVDHKNGNELDCRRKNLRAATPGESSRNGRKRRGEATYKGITRKRKKWSAQIWLDYKKHNLGVFTTQEDAAKAYDDAARKLHGEFACLNFPRKGERSAI